MRAFISYSSLDGFGTHQIGAWIESAGHRTIIYERHFGDGPFTEQMEHGIAESDLFIAVLSQHYLSSKYCSDERTLAEKHRKPILFVRIHHGVLPPAPYEQHRPVELERGTMDERRKKLVSSRLFTEVASLGDAVTDLDAYFSRICGTGGRDYLNGAIADENIEGNRLVVASAVELACKPDGWSEGEIRTEVLEGDHEDTAHLDEVTTSSQHDPGKRNLCMTALRQPLTDEPWLEVNFRKVSHGQVRTIADHFPPIHQRHRFPLFQPERIRYLHSAIVHLLVVTSDDYFLVGHRSGRPRYYENCWGVTCEEHMNPNEEGENQGNPFVTARRALKEELIGRDADARGATDIQIYSVFREYDYWENNGDNPDYREKSFWDLNLGFAGKAKLPIPYKEVFQRWRVKAEDGRPEFRHLIALPYTAENLRRFIHTNSLEPAMLPSEMEVPDKTNRLFPDIMANRLWQLQHPTNKIRIVRCLIHDFPDQCHRWASESAR